MPTEIKKPTVLSAEAGKTAQADTAGLPPPGDARRDEMKRRADELQAANDAFQRDFGPEIGAISREKLMHVDNEIASHFNPASKMLEVTHKQPGRVYQWEQADPYNRWGNLWVTQSKNLGWKVIEGTDPECADTCKQVDGTRRVGDAILMWMPQARYDAMIVADRRRRLSRQQNISEDILRKAESAGVKMHDLTSSKTPEHIRQFARAQAAAATAAQATLVNTMRQARGGRPSDVASALGDAKFEAALRDGVIPGLRPGA